jgi:hypothetical protein
MGWFPPQEFYSIFTGTLHNMFWMKISKRTPKKKKKKKLGLVKWFWLNIFYLCGFLGTIVPTSSGLAKATCKV